jgi:predicted ester cyclase
MPDNLEIIKRFELAFRADDQETIDELCDPDVVDHNPAPGHEGTLAGFKEKVAYMGSHFPDRKEELQDIDADGDTVATRWLLTGSLQQEYMGIPATGRTTVRRSSTPTDRSWDAHEWCTSRNTRASTNGSTTHRAIWARPSSRRAPAAWVWRSATTVIFPNTCAPWVSRAPSSS